ncbi:MAG: ABC transporter permease [Bacteroidia bacterium]|nr:ABC transporter permease [Bacteroidia bacterium]
MFDLDKWQEILQALAKKPLRTVLTALGVFWGILMLILMIGFGNGLEKGVKTDMSDRASNSFFLWGSVTTEPYAGFQPGRRIRMTNDDYFAVKALVKEAKYVCPRNQLGGYRGGNNVTYNGKAGAFEVTGDYPEIRFAEKFNMDKGRFLNHVDLKRSRKICVIGEGVRVQMFEEDEDPIGKQIAINNTYFQVVGLFSSNQTGERGERETQRIYTPFTTFQKTFNYGNRISWFSVVSQDDTPASIAEEKMIALLKRRHKVSPLDERGFGHFNLEEELKEIQNVFFGINAISWIVGFFTLLAGAIGISNIMLINVKERTKEIGIRRAIGAKPWGIISQIMTEAVFLTTIAGYTGLVLGVGLLELVSFALTESGADLGMFAPPYVEIDLMLNALFILIIAGAFAGLLPASRAVRIKPIEALRTE